MLSRCIIIERDTDDRFCIRKNFGHINTLPDISLQPSHRRVISTGKPFAQMILFFIQYFCTCNPDGWKSRVRLLSFLFDMSARIPYTLFKNDQSCSHLQVFLPKHCSFLCGLQGFSSARRPVTAFPVRTSKLQPCIGQVIVYCSNTP